MSPVAVRGRRTAVSGITSRPTPVVELTQDTEYGGYRMVARMGPVVREAHMSMSPALAAGPLGDMERMYERLLADIVRDYDLREARSRPEAHEPRIIEGGPQ